MTAIRWRRYSVTKGCREWTPRRIAAAERAVERDQESVALLPALARYQDVTDRMEQMDARSIAWSARMRQARADAWREARRRLRMIEPHLREGFVELWNSHMMPADPSGLLNLIHSTENPWESLVRLAQLRLHYLQTQAAKAAGEAPPTWHFDPSKSGKKVGPFGARESVEGLVCSTSARF